MAEADGWADGGDEVLGLAAGGDEGAGGFAGYVCHDAFPAGVGDRDRSGRWVHEKDWETVRGFDAEELAWEICYEGVAVGDTMDLP